MSRAAGKGKAVLDALGLSADSSKACFNNHPGNEEEAVQAGLTKWVEGQGKQPPTWGVLLAAMEREGTMSQHIGGLKKDLGLS